MMCEALKSMSGPDHSDNFEFYREERAIGIFKQSSKMNRHCSCFNKHSDFRRKVN